MFGELKMMGRDKNDNYPGPIPPDKDRDGKGFLLGNWHFITRFMAIKRMAKSHRESWIYSHSVRQTIIFYYFHKIGALKRSNLVKNDYCPFFLAINNEQSVNWGHILYHKFIFFDNTNSFYLYTLWLKNIFKFQREFKIWNLMGDYWNDFSASLTNFRCDSDGKVRGYERGNER